MNAFAIRASNPIQRMILGRDEGPVSWGYRRTTRSSGVLAGFLWAGASHVTGPSQLAPVRVKNRKAIEDPDHKLPMGKDTALARGM